jgi:hypothetical protein
MNGGCDGRRAASQVGNSKMTAAEAFALRTYTMVSKRYFLDLATNQ